MDFRGGSKNKENVPLFSLSSYANVYIYVYGTIAYACMLEKKRERERMTLRAKKSDEKTE